MWLQVRYAYPRGESRPSSIGEAKLPGFIFAKGYGKGYVGDGVLRQTHPIGAQPCLWGRAMYKSACLELAQSTHGCMLPCVCKLVR